MVRTAFLRNVRDDGKVELVRSILGMRFLYLLGLFFRTNGRHDGMTALQQAVEDPRSNESATRKSQILKTNIQ